MATRKRKVSQTERLASLKWNIKDAKEALQNAFAMGDWKGVRKYTGQLEKLEEQLRKSSSHGHRRSYKATLLMRHRTTEGARLARERGKRGAP